MNAAKPLRLTATLHQRIMAAIRAGGFPHIAAQAFGVTPAQLESWLRRGEQSRGREPYRAFAREFREAYAQARLKAEVHVFEEDPPRWLEHGPARDRVDNPGWASAVRALTDLEGERNALADPEFVEFIHRVTSDMADFPEAQKRLVRLLTETPQRKAA